MITRARTSEELPAMRATETIDEYDLVAFRDNLSTSPRASGIAWRNIS
jgi:hypothetical protein